MLKTGTFVFTTMVVGHESPFFYALFSVKPHFMVLFQISDRIKLSRGKTELMQEIAYVVIISVLLIDDIQFTII